MTWKYKEENINYNIPTNQTSVKYDCLITCVLSWIKCLNDNLKFILVNSEEIQVYEFYSKYSFGRIP